MQAHWHKHAQKNTAWWLQVVVPGISDGWLSTRLRLLTSTLPGWYDRLCLSLFVSCPYGCVRLVFSNRGLQPFFCTHCSKVLGASMACLPKNCRTHVGVCLSIGRCVWCKPFHLQVAGNARLIMCKAQTAAQPMYQAGSMLSGCSWQLLDYGVRRKRFSAGNMSPQRQRELFHANKVTLIMLHFIVPF